MEKNIDYTMAKRIADMYPSRCLDGKSCISEMRDYEINNHIHTNWRQMEWFGWYSEFLCTTNKTNSFSRSQERFITATGASMFFDYVDDLSNIVFDLKSTVAYNGKCDHKLITNDLDAIKNIVRIHGRVLFAVITAEPVMDDDDSLRIWHDKLKGRKTKYVRLGEKHGRPHRKRKKSVILSRVDIFDINSNAIIESMPVMHQGKNSNGKDRPPKMILDTSIINPVCSYQW